MVSRETQARLVAAACAYEVVAIASGRCPTITKLCHTARRHPLWRLPLVMGWGWLTYHLWCEADEVAT